MTPPRRHRLKNLSLKELSLVDRGANQHALQVLRKRHEQGSRASFLSRLVKRVLGADAGSETVTDDVANMSDMLAVSVADILTKCDTPEELDENLTATLDQFKAHLLKAACADDDGDEMDEGDTGDETPPAPKKKPVGKRTDTPHDTEDHMDGHDTALLKGLSPEARTLVEKFAKQAEDATAMAKQAIEKQVESERLTKATTLVGTSNLVVADVALLLKQAEGNADATAAVERMVKQQVALVEKSALFKEQGDDQGDTPAEAHGALQKRAEEIRKTNPKLTIAKAYAMALDENPDLYEDALDEADDPTL